jgi:hypothetical protein
VTTHCFDGHKGLGAEGALGRLVWLAVVVVLVRVQHVVAVRRRKLVHCVRSHVVDADGVHGVADGSAPRTWCCKSNTSSCDLPVTCVLTS